ncbi:hypothetical protein EB796_016598 [Bugula neritina]|uniref:NADH dehydrogenase [ubiquinone] 1 beta subcomplex subunit 3 n=1 Tax=Bugula neritina TaxID=10212 RepID=A0A7J7JGD0_BUGNE|nr:hypothetical protein EB796_016598 [Bugula neritina]
MGGSSVPKIPDYRIYKVEDAPDLLKTQEKLAQHGLKDPWLRNEVWRYTQAGQKGSTTFRIFLRSVFRGFPIAVGVTAAIIAGETAYHKIYPPSHHNDGHH